MLADTTMDIATSLVGDTTPSYFIVGRQDTNYAVTKLNSFGVEDATFGTSGSTVDTFGGDSEGIAIALTTDNKVLVGGINQLGTIEFALVRLLTDGTLDPSFNGGFPVTFNPLANNDMLFFRLYQSH